MELHVDDAAFVRASAGSCYPVLTNVGAWPDVFPRTRVTALGDDRFDLRLGGRGGPGRALRLTTHAGAWRHDQGFTLTVTGDLDGTAEFWLEPGWGGTVVHHLLTARTDRPGPRTLAAYRWWLRAALWSLKDLLQAEQRRTEGLHP